MSANELRYDPNDECEIFTSDTFEYWEIQGIVNVL